MGHFVKIALGLLAATGVAALCVKLIQNARESGTDEDELLSLSEDENCCCSECQAEQSEETSKYQQTEEEKTTEE